jgi:adenylate cyclase
MLFADVRGSTTLAEGMQPTEFRRVMDRFYDVAATVMFGHDGFVDKFVGDEVVAMFFPLLTGQQHAARGIDAARELLTVTGHAGPSDPWIPLGAGLHTGTAWVGAVGSDTHTELTAVGDAVNTAARLAAAAAKGEILVSTDAAGAAGVGQGLERRRLELKGKSKPTEVVVLKTERSSDGQARSSDS